MKKNISEIMIFFLFLVNIAEIRLHKRMTFLQNNKLSDMANAIRFLSADAIEKSKSGHPGMPLGMADVATVLFTKFMKILLFYYNSVRTFLQPRAIL